MISEYASTYAVSALAKTAAMAPAGVRDCTRRPRAAISRIASSSENTPAICAAEISPTL